MRVCPHPASGRRLSGTRRSTGLGLRGVTSLPLELVATSVPLPGACQRFAPSQTLDTLGLQHAGGLAALCVPKAFALPRGLRAPDLGGHRVSPAVALGPQLFTVEEARRRRRGLAGGRHPAEPWAEGGPPDLTLSWGPAPPASPALVLLSVGEGAWQQGPAVPVMAKPDQQAGRLPLAGAGRGPRALSIPGAPGERTPRVSGRGLRPAGHGASHHPPGTEPVTAAPSAFSPPQLINLN